jgi:hypothetical protein
MISLSAQSADLYLLRIDNQQSCEMAQVIVGYAYGNINSKFLVALDSTQLARFSLSGMEVEPIAKGISIEKAYLISPAHTELSGKGISVKALYSDGGNCLAELNREETSQLQSEGYYCIPLMDRKTPFFYRPETVTLYWPDNFPNDSLISRIRQDSIYAYNYRLELFRTRYIWSDSVYRARDWIVDKFLSFGYTNVYIDTFYYYGRACHNVICMKTGTTEPENLVVVGAHYDSYNQDTDPYYFAPGADDNGSGTAAVLELARTLSDVALRKSIMFVAFSAEEVGLVGSDVVAHRLYNEGASIEFMLNYDMIGYSSDVTPDVALYHGASRVYAEVISYAALRVTDLEPYYAGFAMNSDHASFAELGYYVAYVQEGDFNNAGWHHDEDVTSRMDFPYMAKLMKMSIAALGQVDLAARPTDIDAVYDIGDGQSLRIAWDNDCQSEYSYKILYGIQSKAYTDTIDVPSGFCQYDLAGLDDGQKYYISVMGTNIEGHGPLYLTEKSGTPYEIPRAPANLSAKPDLDRIILSWNANRELDINGYILLRRASGAGWSVLGNNLIDTIFIDSTAYGHLRYDYCAIAVDNSNNESDSSAVASAIVATFDAGLLFVEETWAGGMDPSDSLQEVFYDSIFGAHPYQKYYFEPDSIALSRSLAGQYGSILWIDDDVSSHLFGGSTDSINWFLGYDSTNLLLAGFETVFWICGSEPMNAGDFGYDNFGIWKATENQNLDFVGAVGRNGWPTLHTSSNNVFHGIIPTVAVFDTLPGTEVIYTYDSYSNNPVFEGKPAGVVYHDNGGIRIALSFPIYYLTEVDAEALISKVVDYFGEDVVTHPYGDANGDGRLNIIDVTFIITYLYNEGTPPPDPDYADPNGSCVINLLDITYLINYLYKGGFVPLPGCVP